MFFSLKKLYNSGLNMKIALIMVKSKVYRFKNRSIFFNRMPDCLTLGMLHSIVKNAFPEIEIQLYDETVEVVKKEEIDADLIGISAITPCINRAYEYARYFKNKDKTVFIGGVHATLLPQEVKKHCDSVVVGLANETLPALIRDFTEGNLKDFYCQDQNMSFENMVFPSRCIYEEKSLFGDELNMVQATFGCMNMCGFCVQPYVCFGHHKRPVADVIEEIKQIKDSYIEFYDPNLAKDKEYLKELCKALIPLKKQWFAPMTISVCYDEELLELMKKSGCCQILIGFESISQASVKSINKKFNTVDEYKGCVKTLHKHGIKVMGSFVLGLDGDDKNSFGKILEFVNDAHIDFVRYTINTPYPGTPYYEEMKKSGRIIQSNWDYYDCRHCVIQPALMTKDELEKGYDFLWHKTYSLLNVIKRLNYGQSKVKFLKQVVHNFVFGIVYNSMVHKRSEGNFT